MQKTEDIFVSQSAYKPGNYFFTVTLHILILLLIKRFSIFHFTTTAFEISAHLATDSSTSLAGSLVVPSSKPYCVHDTLQEEYEGDFPEKEHSNVDYTLLDSEKMGPCKSTEFIEDNVTYAEDSEASIEEDIDVDVTEMAKMKYMYEIEQNFEIVDAIEADVEDYHIFESKQTVKIDNTAEEDEDDAIARFSIVENDTAGDILMDGVENEDGYDSVVENDIDYDDAVDIINDDKGSENDDIDVKLDKNSLNDVVSIDVTLQNQNLETGNANQDKNEIEDEYIGSLLEIKKDIEDIVFESHIHSGQNITLDKVVSNDNKHVDGVESVEKDAKHVIAKDLVKTRGSTKSIDAKSHIEISPELSQQYIHVDELIGPENLILEKSTVPKTPFHSVTNFDDEDEDEIPQ